MSVTPRWIYPPMGRVKQPIVAETNFGPIHRLDSMILEFTPASYTGEIQLYCDWNNHTSGSGLGIGDNTGSPLTYNFLPPTPNSQDATDYHACYFFFTQGDRVNGQVFQYLNDPSETPVMWRSSGSTPLGGGSSTAGEGSTTGTSISTKSAVQASTSSSLSSSSSGSTPSASSSSSGTQANGSLGSATSTPTSAPEVTTQSSSPSISGGAIAGIVIGVLIAIGLMVGIGFFLGRRAKKSKNNNENNTAYAEAPSAFDSNYPTTGAGMGAYNENNRQPHELDYNQIREKQNAYGIVEAPGTEKGHGNVRSELDSAQTYELHNQHRNELHG